MKQEVLVLYQILRNLAGGWANVGLWSDAPVPSGVAGTLFGHHNDVQNEVTNMVVHTIQDSAKPAARGDGSSALIGLQPIARWICDQIGIGTDAQTADNALGSLQSKLRTLYSLLAPTTIGRDQFFRYNCTLAYNAAETTIGTVGTESVVLRGVSIDPQATADVAKLTSLNLKLKRGAVVRSALLDDALMPAVAITAGSSVLVWQGFIPCEVGDILTMDPTPVAASADPMHLHVTAWYQASGTGGVIA
jgi:hypothetical protein